MHALTHNQNPADLLAARHTLFRYGISGLLAAALSRRAGIRKITRSRVYNNDHSGTLLSISLNKNWNVRERETRERSLLENDFETNGPERGAPRNLSLTYMCPDRSHASIVGADNARGEYRYRERDRGSLAIEADDGRRRKTAAANGNI